LIDWSIGDLAASPLKTPLRVQGLPDIWPRAIWRVCLDISETTPAYSFWQLVAGPAIVTAAALVGLVIYPLLKT
jgi:hypothetical protein